MLDQSNIKWRHDRIRRLYVEGYGLAWIRNNSPYSTLAEINRAIQLPYRMQGPVKDIIVI